MIVYEVAFLGNTCHQEKIPNNDSMVSSGKDQFYKRYYIKDIW